MIDLGPGAGRHGGELVAQGTPKQIIDSPASLTGAYISGRTQIEMRPDRRSKNGAAIAVLGAKENNLKNVDVSFPLGVITVVTGVSGSGKSTLVNETAFFTVRWRKSSTGRAKNLVSTRPSPGPSFWIR